MIAVGQHHLDGCPTRAPLLPAMPAKGDNVKTCARTGRHRAVVQVDGRRRYGPWRTNRKQALTDVRRIRMEHGDDWSAPRTDFTLADGLQLAIDDLRLGEGSEQTVAFYECQFRAICRHFDPSVPLVRITPNTLRTFVERRRQVDGVSASTVAKQLQLLRRIYRLAQREGHVALDVNPVARIRKPRVQHVRNDHLEPEELRAILAYMRGDEPRERGWRDAGRDADIVELLFLTGLRRAGLARVRVSDLRLDGESPQLFVRGKVRDEPMILGPEAAAIFRRLLDRARGDWLFDADLQRAQNAVSRVFTRWRPRLEAAGLLPRGRFNPHVQRHSLGTALVDQGVAEQDAQQILRHATPSMTRHYYHAKDARAREGLRRAAEALRSPKDRQPDADPSAARTEE